MAGSLAKILVGWGGPCWREASQCYSHLQEEREERPRGSLVWSGLFCSVLVYSVLFCSVLAWDELQHFRFKHCLKTEIWGPKGEVAGDRKKERAWKKFYDWIAMKSRFDKQIAFQSSIDMRLSTNNINFCKIKDISQRALQNVLMMCQRHNAALSSQNFLQHIRKLINFI